MDEKTWYVHRKNENVGVLVNARNRTAAKRKAVDCGLNVGNWVVDLYAVQVPTLNGKELTLENILENTDYHMPCVQCKADLQNDENIRYQNGDAYYFKCFEKTDEENQNG